MERFAYSKKEYQRGLSAVFVSVACLLLFSFFLLAGFDDARWMPWAFGGVALACLLLFVRGVLQARANIGEVCLDGEKIGIVRRGKIIELRFEQIRSVRFRGFLQPCLVLSGGRAQVRVYKTLPGYAALWHQIRQRIPLPLPSSQGGLRVRRVGTDLLGALIAAQGLALFAFLAVLRSFVGGSLGVGSFAVLCVLFLGVFVLGFSFSFGSLGSWVFLDEELRVRTLFARKSICVSSLRRVALEQAPIRSLVSGYRYRGPALPASVQFAPAGLGLRLTVETDAEPLVISEADTRYPLELLFEIVMRRYGIPAEMVTR